MENINNFKYRDKFYEKASITTPKGERPDDILSKQMQYWN